MFEVKVSWDGTENFTGGLDDISSEVQMFRFGRGRDSELDHAPAGKCLISVRDTGGKYVPENTSSPLYGSLLPARPVRIRAQYKGTWYNLYFGYLDDIQPHPIRTQNRAYLPCTDGFDQLSRACISMPLQVDQKSGQLFATALDRAGWSTTKRRLDSGIDVYPLVHAERQLCKEFLQKLETSEFGFMYIGGDGYLNWEDRHHRLKAPHITSQWIAKASLYKEIDPTHSLVSVRNAVILTAQPKSKATALTDLWKLQENKDKVPANSPLLAAGEMKVYYATFADSNGVSNIAGDVVAPVADTDYLGNRAQDGSGENRTADITITTTILAGSAKLEVKNTSATSFYLTLLKIRGKIYTDLGELQIESVDATSQAKYLYRDLKVDLPYYQSADIMQGMADYQLSVRKEPIPGYVVSLEGGTDELMTQLLARELSDRITLQSAKYYIDADFYINKIEMELGEDGVLRGKWTITRAQDEEYWVLGTSALGTGTRLAY